MIARLRAQLAVPAGAIVLALLVGALVIIVTSPLAVGSLDFTLPLATYWALVQGSVGSIDGIVDTLRAASPLILVGLAVALPFKAGLFNIGGQGQFLIGAVTAAWVGAALSGASPFVAIPVAVLAGMLAGAAYGFIPGWLKAYTGAHEVVTTIMLNYIAMQIVSYLIQGPLKAPGASFARSADVGNSALPVIFQQTAGHPAHLGIIFPYIAAVLVWWLLYRTTIGFEIRTAGANPDAARYAGMRPRFLIVLTMVIAGLLVGLAGAGEILGVQGYMVAGYSTNVGFDAITVALLGRTHPFGVVLAGLLLGAMRAGAPLMQISAGIPVQMVDVLQGVILFFLTADIVVRWVFRIRAGGGGLEKLATVSPSSGVDSEMNLLDIPVLGLALQLLGYLVTVCTQNGTIILALTAPLAFGALCGVMCERSGVVNIGIEGTMLAAAFVGWFVASIASQAMPADPSPFFGATPGLVIGLLAAIVCGMLVSAILAWLAVTLRADQIIAGTIINIVAAGITGYFDVLFSTNPIPTAGKFEAFVPPSFLTDLPVVGWLFSALLNQGPITMSLIVVVIVMEVLLFRSRWGLRTRAVGEHPKAAETVGISVIRLRYQNVILGGVFAGLAGAWFTIDFGNSFVGGMTGGRGFIALAALIFGRWRPVGAFLASLLFATSIALGTAIRTTPPTGQLGTILGAIPEQFFAALPYIVTIVVLAGVVGRSVAPAADGQPYEREAVS